MATVPHITVRAGNTKCQGDGFLLAGIVWYWVAVYVGGVALCCVHGAVRQNVYGYVCWNRNRAVVIIGGTSGIADCCCVACSVKGSTSWIALFTINSSQPTQTQAHARTVSRNPTIPNLSSPCPAQSHSRPRRTAARGGTLELLLL